jgi:3D (Asp-Asp-Asp) domain-containing protein
MVDTHVGTAATNQQSGSVKQVVVEDLLCSLSAIPNALGDTLPIIPSGSNVQGGKVLFQMIFRAHLTQRADGKEVAGHALAITSSNGSDKISYPFATDAHGHLTITLETRDQGERNLTTSTAHVTLMPLNVSVGEAWYQGTFQITGYNVCDEDDFSGKLVDGIGLSEQHKSDFLYSAYGIPMQGTGKTSDGKYVRLASMRGGWHLSDKGHKDRVNDPTEVSFAYADGVQGAFGSVSENHSIAVDPNIIPPNSRVNVNGIGDRSADDRGSGINGYHIDNFLGGGTAVVKAWKSGGINGTQQRIKFLGY